MTQNKKDMVSKIVINNKLNILVDLNIDSFIFEGENFEKGDIIKVKNSKITFELKHFQLVISKYSGLPDSSTIMLMGDDESICFEYAILIKKN